MDAGTGPVASPDVLDKLREAVFARFKGGLSPESMALAGFDWALHLAGAPGKRLALLRALGHPAPLRFTWFCLSRLSTPN